MSNETHKPSDKNDPTNQGGLETPSPDHSGKGGFERPVTEYGLSLKDAVDTGVISSTEAPETTEGLPEELQAIHHPEAKRLGKRSIAALTAGALTIAGGAFFLGRSGGSEPNPTASRPPAATSSPNPGPSTPEVTRPTTVAPTTSEAPVGAAEQQNETYRRADVPNSVLSVDFLKKYDVSAFNPKFLEKFTGTEARAGLIPNYNQVMFEHLNALTDATPERIAAASKLIDTVLNAKYTRLTQDGQVETGVGAGEFFSDVPFTPGNAMDDYEHFISAKTAQEKAQEVASSLVYGGDYYAFALDKLKRENAALTEYAKSHPNDASFTPNEITPTTIASLGFLNPNRYNMAEVAALNADQRAFTLGTRAYIVKVYDVDELITRQSADGSTDSHLKAFTVIAEKSSDDHTVTEIDVETYVAVPVNTYVEESVVTGKDTVKTAKGLNFFQPVKVYSTPISTR